MNILEDKRIIIKKIQEEKDNKHLGKRYIINYNDIIPSFNKLIQENEEILDSTILEYCGKGIYKDLLTNNIVADSYIYNISEKIDFQFDLFNINKHLKAIDKKESEAFLDKITEEQKEKIIIILLKARINALNNALRELKEHDTEENKVKSLQK